MSALIIGYGPSGSGKSVAAQAWRAEDSKKRIVIEEGNLGLATLRASQGYDVWLNLPATRSIQSVEVRAFGEGQQA